MAIWIAKFYRSATLWLLVWNLFCSAAIAYMFAGWDESFYATHTKTFALCVFWLVFVPRLVGICVGSWGCSGCVTHDDRALPRGSWIMFGNAWPEYAIVFHDVYPEASAREIEGVDYKQTTTLFGIMLYVGHVLASALWYAHTSDRRAPHDATNSYYIPEVILFYKIMGNQCIQLVAKSGIFHSVWIDVSKHPLVWKRMDKRSKNTLYYWVHETHPNLPYDDWIQLPRYDRGVCSTFVSLSVSLALPILAISWSRGVLALVVAMEPFIRFGVSIGASSLLEL